MNRLDELIQRHMPAIMIPRHGHPLADCRMGQTRFLMAEDGLYLETRQPWGFLVRRLWTSPRALPYGPVAARDNFQYAMAEAHRVFEVHLEEAEHMAEKGLEWAGWVVWTDGKWSFVSLGYKELSAISARKIHPKLPDGACVVLDVHSHHRMPAFFSRQDNEDDKGGVKIAQVIGGYTPTCGFDELRSRYCVEGFFFNLDLEDGQGDDPDGLLEDDAFEGLI